jgi:hypothetical protein
LKLKCLDEFKVFGPHESHCSDRSEQCLASLHQTIASDNRSMIQMWIGKNGGLSGLWNMI